MLRFVLLKCVLQCVAVCCSVLQCVAVCCMLLTIIMVRQVEIMRIKGTPTREEMFSMNPNLADFNFPKIPEHGWPQGTRV